mgnify:CR=1 FL=1
MTDQIILTGVRAHGRHGVFAHERADGQEFIVDVVVDLATQTAAETDVLADTVDYGVIAQCAHDRIIGEPYDLIEALAEAIAADCLAMKGVNAVTVTVHKPQAPISVPFDDVAVRIFRKRSA